MGKIAKWFLFLKPWNERDVHNVRITWTQWYGVPMHAWNPKFFKPVSLKFGKLIRIDDDTLSKRKLQYMRILIRTPRSEIPKNPFTVKVDGRIFYIRIKEESEDADDNYSDWSSDETGVMEQDDNSWWNSEDVGSNMEDSLDEGKESLIGTGKELIGKSEESPACKNQKFEPGTINDGRDILIAAREIQEKGMNKTRLESHE
ncbi:hypothetical protein ACS0TY_018550 [Phlomoides rotata]